jgi:hypothetical protein
MSDEKKDIKDDLNSLWKSTLDQFDEIKDAIVRSSTAGKAKLDVAMLERQRDKLLMELGRAYLAAAEAGEVSLPEKLVATLERIQDLDEQIAQHEDEVGKLLEGTPFSRAGGTKPDQSLDDDPDQTEPSGEPH